MSFRNLLLAVVSFGSLQASEDFCLPTENDFIFSNHQERFYMHAERFFEGEASKPWMAGCYGYVRNMRRINNNLVIGTRFHEGIDIKPLKRDTNNNPLDRIGAISAGKVVHVNTVSSKSNYGRYVVVEHQWEKTKVYSLYSHLSEITCQLDQKVEAGGELGIMGYSGRGLNRERSHLHLELNLLITTRYDEWSKANGMINHHGIFNGINLSGCDIGQFYHEKKSNPELQFSEFIASQPVYFKVLTPGKGTPDFVKRYPWICHGDTKDAQSWEISFSATGFPVAFKPSTKKVTKPYITSIRPSEEIPHQYQTRYLVSGIGNRASLGSNGLKLVNMLMDNF